MFTEAQTGFVGTYEIESVASAVGRFQVALTSMVGFLTLFAVLRWKVSAAVFGKTYTSLSVVDRFRWNEKSVSVVHATIATVGSVASTWHTFWRLEGPMASMANYNEILVPGRLPLHRDMYIQISIGYFLSDLILYTLPPIHHSAFEFGHHVVAASSYALGVYYQWGTWIQINFLMNELSTPFLQFSWFFRWFGLRHSPLDKANRFVFALLFFLARVLWNSIFTWHVLVGLAYVTWSPVVTRPLFWTQVVLITAHCSLQYFWFYKIVAIALGKSKDPQASTANGKKAKAQ